MPLVFRAWAWPCISRRRLVFYSDGTFSKRRLQDPDRSHSSIQRVDCGEFVSMSARKSKLLMFTATPSGPNRPRWPRVHHQSANEASPEPGEYGLVGHQRGQGEPPLDGGCGSAGHLFSSKCTRGQETSSRGLSLLLHVARHEFRVVKFAQFALVERGMTTAQPPPRWWRLLTTVWIREAALPLREVRRPIHICARRERRPRPTVSDRSHCRARAPSRQFGVCRS